MSATLAPFTVDCPSCGTSFPVDPGKVPEEGIYAICSECSRTFLVSRPAGGEEADEPPAHGDALLDAPPAEDSGEAEAAATEDAGAVEEFDLDMGDFGAEAPEAETAVEPEEEEAAEPEEAGFGEGLEAGEPVETEAGADATTGFDEALEGFEVEEEVFEFEEETEDEGAVVGDEEPAAPATPTGSAAPPEEPPAPPAAPPAEEPAAFEDLRGLASEAVSEGADSTHAGGSTLSEGARKFGKRDPDDRARRLARVLVSDIIAYYPERFQESRARGTVKEDFEAEVEKSWKEYVDQVGQEMAESTPYFTEALNEILGGGKEIF